MTATATAGRTWVCPQCGSRLVMYIPVKGAWCNADERGFPHPSAQMVERKGRR